MTYNMYVCPDCRKVFKINGPGKKAKCPKCVDALLVDTNETEDTWKTYNVDKRNSIITEILYEPEIVEVEAIADKKAPIHENIAKPTDIPALANKDMQDKSFNFFDALNSPAQEKNDSKPLEPDKKNNASKRKPYYIPVILCSAAIVLLLIVLGIYIPKYYKKQAIYERMLAYREAEDYYNAIKMCEAIPGFKDVDQVITELKGEKAVAEGKKSEEYTEEAYKTLQSSLDTIATADETEIKRLIGLVESASVSHDVSKEQDQIYKRAANIAFNSSDYEKAADYFSKINDTSTLSSDDQMQMKTAEFISKLLGEWENSKGGSVRIGTKNIGMTRTALKENSRNPLRKFSFSWSDYTIDGDTFITTDGYDLKMIITFETDNMIRVEYDGDEHTYARVDSSKSSNSEVSKIPEADYSAVTEDSTTITSYDGTLEDNGYGTIVVAVTKDALNEYTTADVKGETNTINELLAAGLISYEVNGVKVNLRKSGIAVVKVKLLEGFNAGAEVYVYAEHLKLK